MARRRPPPPDDERIAALSAQLEWTLGAMVRWRRIADRQLAAKARWLRDRLDEERQRGA